MGSLFLLYHLFPSYNTLMSKQHVNWKRKEKKKKRKKENNYSKDNKITILIYSTIREFLLFSTILLFVKMVFSIRTFIAVCLVVTFTVDALAGIRARLTIFCSKLWRNYLVICFTVPQFFPVILGFMWTIA